MDPHRGFHRRFFNKRQGLGGVLGSILSSSTPSSVSQSTTSSASSQGTGNAVGLSGIVGGITSVISDVPTPILPSSEPSSTTTSSTPLTHSSSSSTGSTTPSASASSVKITSSSTSSTISTSGRPLTTSTTPTPTPIPTPTPTPSVSNTVFASSDGTRIVYITSTLSAASATASPTTSFLQNPSLEGGIFALVGIVALIIIFVVVTWAIRKRRRDRLERDTAAAVTFDPGATDHYEHQEDANEKRRLSASSSGHGHGYGYGYGMQPAYAPPQEYHGPVGYGQYPAAAYPAPSSNTVPYQTPSPAVPQPAAQGGANLTRKFSDRKPVPPLLLSPGYDPSNSHVSIPPQFKQQ